MDVFCILGHDEASGSERNVSLGLEGVPTANAAADGAADEAERAPGEPQVTVFLRMLARVVGGPAGAHFTPAEDDLHQAIHTILLQVAAPRTSWKS